MDNTFFLYTTCTNSEAVGDYGESIHEMMDSLHLRDISNACFISKHAKEKGILKDVLAVANSDRIVAFNKDFAVSCYSSVFQGVPCLIVRASAIEHVFINTKHGKLMLNKKDAAKRINVAEELQNFIVEDPGWIKIKTKMKRKAYLEAFATEHIATFTQHNLLMDMVMKDETELARILLDIDKNVILPARGMTVI